MSYAPVRVAVVGNVDSGKSTMIGVMTSGELDDGRGKMRCSVATHSHEIDSGRTSTIATELLGFDEARAPVFAASHHGTTAKSGLTKSSKKGKWKELMKKSTRQVVLIDLCGHLKYLKTTISGLTGMTPHYCLVMVAANKGGVPRMTKEHVGIVCALDIPVAIIVTKIDIAPPDIFKATMKKVRGMLRLARKIPLVVRELNEEQIETAARQVGIGGRIAPVFLASNVTGQGIDAIRAFLAALRPPALALSVVAAASKVPLCPTLGSVAKVGDDATGAVEGGGATPASTAAGYDASLCPLVRIDATFLVTGCGVVLSGLAVQGSITANQTLMLGPDRSGLWRRVVVRSIQSHQQPLAVVKDSRQAAFAIKAVNRKDQVKTSDIRRGMVLVGDSPPYPLPCAVWEFEANLLVLHHQTTIRIGYAPIVHIFFVRQAARIVSIRRIGGHAKTRKGAAKKKGDGTAAAADTVDDEDPSPCLRTGDRAVVRFRFLYYAEHIVPDAPVLMREGRAKAVGRVVALGDAPDIVDGGKAGTKRSTKWKVRKERRSAEFAPKLAEQIVPNGTATAMAAAAAPLISTALPKAAAASAAGALASSDADVSDAIAGTGGTSGS